MVHRGAHRPLDFGRAVIESSHDKNKDSSGDCDCCEILGNPSVKLRSCRRTIINLVGQWAMSQYPGTIRDWSETAITFFPNNVTHLTHTVSDVGSTLGSPSHDYESLKVHFTQWIPQATCILKQWLISHFKIQDRPVFHDPKRPPFPQAKSNIILFTANSSPSTVTQAPNSQFQKGVSTNFVLQGRGVKIRGIRRRNSFIVGTG